VTQLPGPPHEGRAYIKIWGSACLLPAAIIAFLWRWTTPGILDTLTPVSVLYALLLITLPILVSIIGWFGAQLTFPLQKGV